MIPVPADRSFTVNYSLNGYLPQAIRSGRARCRATVDVAGGASDGFGAPLPELDAQPGLCAAPAGAAACARARKGQKAALRNSRRSDADGAARAIAFG